MNEHNLWDEMDRLRFCLVKLFFHVIVFPLLPTVFTGQRAFLRFQYKCVFFNGWLLSFAYLVECEQEDFFFDLLQLADGYRNLGDFLEMFFSCFFDGG